jgi:HPt (histidine-containing phosphotransfer) domain-containing protein
MVTDQGAKLVNLARDIVEIGLSRADRFIVMRASGTGEDFLVLDGNRRVVALKLLNEPDLASGLLGSTNLQRLRSLAKQFEDSPITQVRAEVYASQEEAVPWIERRHRTEMDGVGLVNWGALEKQRFSARHGVRSPALQILDFVVEHGQLSEDALSKLNRLATTNLDRLIADPDVRQQLGIDKDGLRISTKLPNEEVVRGLQRIVEDLVYKRINVTDIEHKEDRVDYLRKFAESELPDSNKATLEPHLLGEQAGTASGTSGTAVAGSTPTQGGQRTGRRKPRVGVIPRACNLNIDNERISNIYSELKRLKVDDYPNAAAVLLRVFIELSVGAYIQRNNIIQNEHERRNTKLRHQLIKVSDYMKNNNLMTDQELLPVRRAASDQHLLAASINTLHGYVHNEHFSPIPSELKTAWDNLQPFMEEIWK